MPSQNGQPNTSMQGGSGRATGNGGMGPELPVQPQTPYAGPRYMGPPPGTPVTSGPAPTGPGGGMSPAPAPPPTTPPPAQPGIGVGMQSPGWMAGGRQMPTPGQTPGFNPANRNAGVKTAAPPPTPAPYGLPTGGNILPARQQQGGPPTTAGQTDAWKKQAEPQRNAWGNFGGGGTQI